MRPRPDLLGTTGDALAPLVSALLGDYDVLELIDRVLSSATALVGASGAAVLVPDGDGLQVLAATSETAAELELFQAMSSEGPAVDCLSSGAPVLVDGPDAMRPRWPRFFPVAERMGVRSVASLPMGVRGEPVGALTLFDPAPDLGPERERADGLRGAQALADLAVLAIMQAGCGVTAEEVLAQVRASLDRRVLVEQAKGVVAEWTGLPPARTGRILLHHARTHGLTLEELARQVVHLEIDGASLTHPGPA